MTAGRLSKQVGRELGPSTRTLHSSSIYSWLTDTPLPTYKETHTHDTVAKNIRRSTADHHKNFFWLWLNSNKNGQSNCLFDKP